MTPICWPWGESSAQIMAERIVDVFLDTQFEGGRHARRVGLVMDVEKD